MKTEYEKEQMGRPMKAYDRNLLEKRQTWGNRLKKSVFDLDSRERVALILQKENK